jgi:hypothetical protein
MLAEGAGAAKYAHGVMMLSKLLAPFRRAANSPDLRSSLLSDLQMTTKASGRPAYLYALIEMGQLSDDEKDERRRQFAAVYDARPLLKVPGYEVLTPHGPVLVSHTLQPGDPFSTIISMDHMLASKPGSISAWLVSAVPPAPLAKHFEQAAVALNKERKPHLIRWCAPHGLPILHKLADRQWVRWLFGPLASWWYPIVTKRGETWRRLEGGGQNTPAAPVQLVMTEELWEALAGDPFPYQLVNFLEQQDASMFQSDCYGVRVAQVEEIIADGRSKGLSSQADLTMYVTGLLSEPELLRQANWQAAIANAASGKAPLKTYFGVR